MPEPIQSQLVNWQEWQESKIHRLRFKPLHDTADAHMGVCLAELPPGCNTEPAHYHSEEEEHIYILVGRVRLRLGDNEYLLTQGNYVCFSAGDPKFHALYNDTNFPCTYLLWGERKPEDLVTHDERSSTLSP